MSDLYTDDDVKRLAEKLLADYDSEFDASHLSWQDFAAQATELLSLVAPAIAARALREAARAYRSARDERASITYLQCESFLLARANGIEMAI